jgi:hypothetical protein
MISFHTTKKIKFLYKDVKVDTKKVGSERIWEN